MLQGIALRRRPFVLGVVIAHRSPPPPLLPDHRQPSRFQLQILFNLQPILPPFLQNELLQDLQSIAGSPQSSNQKISFLLFDVVQLKGKLKVLFPLSTPSLFGVEYIFGLVQHRPPQVLFVLFAHFPQLYFFCQALPPPQDFLSVIVSPQSLVFLVLMEYLMGQGKYINRRCFSIHMHLLTTSLFCVCLSLLCFFGWAGLVGCLHMYKKTEKINNFKMHIDFLYHIDKLQGMESNESNRYSLNENYRFIIDRRLPSMGRHIQKRCKLDVQI